MKMKHVVYVITGNSSSSHLSGFSYSICLTYKRRGMSQLKTCMMFLVIQT